MEIAQEKPDKLSPRKRNYSEAATMIGNKIAGNPH